MNQFLKTAQSPTRDSFIGTVVQGIGLCLFLTLVLGLAYPLAVTAIGQAFFPEKANGSLVKYDDKVVGSNLIGQDFSKTPFFQSRPSATSPQYNAQASSGSNLAPSNPRQSKLVETRAQAWLQATGSKDIPVDLLTASGSGLDPHISLAAALYQLGTVSKKTGVSEQILRSLISKNTEHGLFGGPDYVNVLKLNLDVAYAAKAKVGALK